MSRSALWMLAAAGLVGCGPIKLPRLPERVVTPEAAVTGVRLVEAGPRGARYDVDVTLHNPNDFPLPLTFAEYEFRVGGATYRSDTLPLATLPALGRITITLPAVLPADDGPPTGGAYATAGRITITPAGEVRRLLYEIGFPKPKARFAGEGEPQRPGAPPGPPAPAERGETG